MLTQLGFKDIDYTPSQHLLSCPRIGGDNPKGLLLYTNTLRYLFTTQSGSGNIFTLVMKMRKVNFVKALHLVVKYAEITVSDVEIRLPFNGFYKYIQSGTFYNEKENKVYTDEDLPPANALSKRFIEDNISALTQEKWGVRYYHEKDCVLIPIRNTKGEIVGCKARSNRRNISSSQRWWAYLNYPKTQYVYGYYENYQSLVRAKRVYVFESEKSVLQCDSFDVNNVVAIGGHSVSNEQARIIKSLICDEIVVAFDEGLNEEEVAYEAKKLRMNNKVICNKIGYIWDGNNDIMEKGSKVSPSDLGKNKFQNLAKEYIVWI